MSEEHSKQQGHNGGAATQRSTRATQRSTRERAKNKQQGNGLRGKKSD
jgi:hypothetical protein